MIWEPVPVGEPSLIASSATFIFHGSLMRADLRLGTFSYSIDTLGPGKVVISEIDRRRLPVGHQTIDVEDQPDAMEAAVPLGEENNAASLRERGASEGDGLLKILLLLASRSNPCYGSPRSVIDRFYYFAIGERQLTKAFHSYVSEKRPFQVEIDCVTYNASGKLLQEDLSWLSKNTGDVRAEYAADIVVLIIPWQGIADGKGRCGAHVGRPLSNPDNGYVVISNICFDRDRPGLAHEIGHVFKMDHERKPDVDANYAYGWIFEAGLPWIAQGKMGTIMVSGERCTECVHARIYSNPHTETTRDFIKGPFGIAADAPRLSDNTYNRAHNVKVLEDNWDVIANYL